MKEIISNHKNKTNLLIQYTCEYIQRTLINDRWQSITELY